MVNYTCDICNKVFISKRSILNHKNRKTPCDSALKCTKCERVFSSAQSLTRHKNKKKTCVPTASASIENEIKLLDKKTDATKEILNIKKEITLEILNTKKDFELEILEKKKGLLEKKEELIEKQKQKELDVEAKRAERKKQVSDRANVNYIAKQINIHFPASEIIPCTYENCMTKIVAPFIKRINSGGYNAYKLVYESSLDKTEIAITVLKDVFHDEKDVSTRNIIYSSNSDMFMVVLQKAWVSQRFDYIANIINDTFNLCFHAIQKNIGFPIRGNFISEKAFDKAKIKYSEIEQLAAVEVSANELENISKDGLNIDDAITLQLI